MVPLNRNIILPKRDTIIGSDFKNTELGHSIGAIRQYRGPYATHIREYTHHYCLHRDRIDPRHDPLGHLIYDAPDDLAGLALGLVCGLVAGKYTYDKRKDVSNSAIIEAAFIAGFVIITGFAIGKWLTT